jgi:hypothetical protein
LVYDAYRFDLTTPVEVFYHGMPLFLSNT